MAASKKQIRQSQQPRGKAIVQGGNPDEYYQRHPSWNFAGCDKEKWSIQAKNTQDIFWNEIFPHFQFWETQTWAEILLKAKKQNHSITPESLNKAAADRLLELYIEADSLISLRTGSTHRIYGYMDGSVFHILWVDLEHGDNSNCVCRAYKKHT